MLSYFRLNDPFRIVVVLIICILIKIPIFISGGILTTQELNWMLLGERLTQGKILYAQVIDNIAPLAGMVYWFVHILFGRSLMAYHLIAMLLILIQGFYINLAFNQTRVFNEKTFVPLLIYVLFNMVSFDISTLSPVLMSVTFLAFALKNLLYLDSQSPVEDLFKTGFYIGIATLFYLPNFLFLPASILCFALFRTSSIRSLLNIFSGFLLCIFMLLLYFAYKGNLVEFYRFFISSATLSKTWLYDLNQLLILFAFPAIILLISIIKLKSARGFINYQQNSHWLIIIWTIFTFLVMFVSPKISSVSFVIFAPIFAFFFSQYLLLQKKKFIAEITLIAITFILLGNAFYLFYSIGTDNDFYKKITVKTDVLEGKKEIMVFGNKIDAYYHNGISSPFLNWKISKEYIGSLQEYSVINYVKNSILEESPELIVDYSDNKISNTIFEQIPLLLEHYQPAIDSTVIIYKKRKDIEKP